MTTKELAPESEEQRFRLKCKELKKRIEEIDQSNELATLAISRTKNSIRRLRLEYSILLERLEHNALNLPENFEEMSPPPSPSLDINDERTLKGPAIKKQKRNKAESTTGAATAKTKIRDPNLPKRPTNAYLIFCELEKERMKQSTGDNSLASVSDLGKSLVESWKNLDEEGRKPYHKIYEEDKERYKQEMMAYNKSNRLNVPVEGDDVDMDLEQGPDEDPEINDVEADTEHEPIETPVEKKGTELPPHHDTVREDEEEKAERGTTAIGNGGESQRASNEDMATESEKIPEDQKIKREESDSITFSGDAAETTA